MWINLGARNLRNLGTSDVVVRARQTGFQFLDGPRRREAACHLLTRLSIVSSFEQTRREEQAQSF
jgi:hypothetical protein